MKKKKTIKVGIIGNPNSGKTTLFNAITGARHKVGNYPGVTVEKKEGVKYYKDIKFIIYDLPGVYSLTAYSIDEIITRDFIIEEKPDIVVDVIDSTNIERNLFLLLQFMELNVPMVCALNMYDQAKSMGITIDEKSMKELLDTPVVKTVATKGEGVGELLEEIIRLYENNSENQTEKFDKLSYGAELGKHINNIANAISIDKEFSDRYPAKFFALKLLEKDKNALARLGENKNKEEIERILNKAIEQLESHNGVDAEIYVSQQRYGFVHGIVKEIVKKEGRINFNITENIDRVLLNRFLALPIFLLILWGIFQLTFKLGEYPMRWMENLFSFISDKALESIPEGLLQSLVVDGIIGGLGGVLSFVPLIILLFFFLSFLEDTGYMARAAFIMDKFLHIFGLHGQSFLPMMLGFGCSVPAIMASRTLKNSRDRIITILVTPFMSCGAKLPVHILLAATFFPNNSANMIILIYTIGIVLALLSSLLLRKTVLKGESTPFVMELPPYRMPTLKGLFFHVWDKSWMYLKKAGTVLLAASILIWAIIAFPKLNIDEERYKDIAVQYEKSMDKNKIKSEIEDLIIGRIDSSSYVSNKDKQNVIDSIKKGEISVEQKVEEIVKAEVDRYIKNVQAHETLSHSIAGRVGKLIEPVIKPIGFDWKIGISIITGFAAKEAVVSTLGILYKVGEEETEESDSLRDALKNDETFNPLVAFLLMLVTLILAPCIAAMSTIKAEIGWKWLGINIFYTTVLAWSICFVIYQIGKAFFL